VKRSLSSRSLPRAFFDQVEKGETVRVYRNGRPIADVVPAAVPEPASLSLMLAGAGGLLAVRKRRARRSSKTG